MCCRRNLLDELSSLFSEQTECEVAKVDNSALDEVAAYLSFNNCPKSTLQKGFSCKKSPVGIMPKLFPA